ncbi:MAG: cupin domain-containing protein [Stellaceae bacterium]
MTAMVLRLHEDRLPAAGDPVYLPALARALYVIEGDVTVEFARGSASQAAGSAWLGEGEVALLPGAGGARLLRWELAAASAGDRGTLRSAPGAVSEMKLAAEIELDPGFGWLMRCDRVGFPKGGIAYTHVHQGPGIRYCLEGRIEIETEGRAHHYGPGEAWFELGPTPVLAPTSTESETSFVRGFVLPRGCKGRSSIRYVRPEDAARPKPQRYKVLGERFIEVARD